MLSRVIATVVALVVYQVVNTIYTTQATLSAGQVAGRQFENNDTSYIVATYWTQLLSGISTFLPWLLIGALALIWWVPAKRWISTMAALGLLFVGALAVHPEGAYAFFEKIDRTEAYPVLPNQTAFWIPDAGNNIDTQTKLVSKEFNGAQKVEFKRFTIPHMKLTNSSGSLFFGWDFYVPTGRLILVDRASYTRDWQSAAHKGTSSKDESMSCQTNEGLDWSIGLSIGVSVQDDDAFKFLNTFGILPPEGKIRGTSDAIDNDGRILFQSVYYSRSVADVMDSVVHREIHTIICRQVMSRTLDQANLDMNQMMEVVEKQTKMYLANYGITLSFMGWADTVTFAPDIQAAINRRYIAKQDEAVAKTLQPYTETIRVLAAAQALRSFGDRTDGKLPTTVVGMPSDVTGLLGALLAKPGVPVQEMAPPK